VKKKPIAERSSLGTENKGNYGPLYRGTEHQSYRLTEHSKRYLSNLFSSRQRKIVLLSRLS